MTPQQSALIGLTVTWLIVSIAAVVTFDTENGLSPVMTAFLIALGVFSVTQAQRYARLHRQAQTNTSQPPR